MPTTEVKQTVFKSFPEYWHYVKYLTQSQRTAIFDSLPPVQRHTLRRAYNRGGWRDLIVRDKLNDIQDQIQVKYGINLIDLRYKVLKGKSVYIPRTVWDYTTEELSGYSDHHKIFLTGGIRGVICKKNPNVVLLVKESAETTD